MTQPLADDDVLGLLCSIEDLLMSASPGLVRAARLRPSAADVVRRRIATAVGLERLPEQLDSIFRWHDGQEWGPQWPESILEESADFGGWLFVPTGEVLEFFGRRFGLPRWRMSYVPILGDSTGNYAVFDTQSGGVDIWDYERESSAPYGIGLPEILRAQMRAWQTQLG